MFSIHLKNFFVRHKFNFSLLGRFRFTVFLKLEMLRRQKKALEVKVRSEGNVNSKEIECYKKLVIAIEYRSLYEGSINDTNNTLKNTNDMLNNINVNIDNNINKRKIKNTLRDSLSFLLTTTPINKKTFDFHVKYSLFLNKATSQNPLNYFLEKLRLKKIFYEILKNIDLFENKRKIKISGFIESTIFTEGWLFFEVINFFNGGNKKFFSLCNDFYELFRKIYRRNKKVFCCLSELSYLENYFNYERLNIVDVNFYDFVNYEDLTDYLMFMQIKDRLHNYKDIRIIDSEHCNYFRISFGNEIELETVNFYQLDNNLVLLIQLLFNLCDSTKNYKFFISILKIMQIKKNLKTQKFSKKVSNLSENLINKILTDSSKNLNLQKKLIFNKLEFKICIKYKEQLSNHLEELIRSYKSIDSCSFYLYKLCMIFVEHSYSIPTDYLARILIYPGISVDLLIKLTNLYILIIIKIVIIILIYIIEI